MKRIMLIAAATLMMGFAAQAQQNDPQQGYISVTGTAEREIVPNEIYIRIIINENDSKGKTPVAEQEKRMIDVLRRQGINVDKDLKVGDMSGDLTYYVFRRDRVNTSKSYILKVDSAEKLAKVFRGLSDIDISQMGLVKVTRDDIDKIEMELRAEAMRNAREIAETMAGAIGQNVGRAFAVNDNNYGSAGVIYYDNAMPVARAKMEMLSATAEGVDDVSLEFRDLHMEHSVNVRFVLE